MAACAVIEHKQVKQPKEMASSSRFKVKSLSLKIRVAYSLTKIKKSRKIKDLRDLHEITDKKLNSVQLSLAQQRDPTYFGAYSAHLSMP